MFDFLYKSANDVPGVPNYLDIGSHPEVGAFLRLREAGTISLVLYSRHRLAHVYHPRLRLHPFAWESS